MGAVACIELDANIPAIIEESEEHSLTSQRTDCGDQSKDHITNIQTEIVDDVASITMDLDEDLDFINLRADFSFKVPLAPAIDFKLTEVPISHSPGIPAGPLKFVGYPPANATPSNGVVPTVFGSLTFEDKNSEQIRCIGFGADAA